MIFLSVFQSGYAEAQYLIPSDPRSKLQGNQMVLDKHSLRLQDFSHCPRMNFLEQELS